MIIIDNSEYMRNGDYPPSRLEAQADAVNTVFQTKVDSNPENTVGIMTMAGKGPEVLVTHTRDLGQILKALHTVATEKIGGAINIPTAIAIAQLALKHRENKNLRQRIVVFVGSPPTDAPGSDAASLVKLAKKLKKNNVAVDIVSFGDGIEEEEEVSMEVGAEAHSASPLRKFVDNASSGDNSHLLVVQPGSTLLSDALITSPVLAADRAAGIPEELQGGGGDAGPSQGGAANDFEFGVDPSLDPELAMALRLSMQEANAREAVANPSAAGLSADQPPASSAAAPSTNAGQAAAAGAVGAGAGVAAGAAVANIDGDDEDDALLQQALALSHEEDGEDVEMDGSDEEGDEEGDEDEEDDDEDAAIARAIQMSMEEQQEEDKKGK